VKMLEDSTSLIKSKITKAEYHVVRSSPPPARLLHTISLILNQIWKIDGGKYI